MHCKFNIFILIFSEILYLPNLKMQARPRVAIAVKTQFDKVFKPGGSRQSRLIEKAMEIFQHVESILFKVTHFFK